MKSSSPFKLLGILVVISVLTFVIRSVFGIYGFSIATIGADLLSLPEAYFNPQLVILLLDLLLTLFAYFIATKILRNDYDLSNLNPVLLFIIIAIAGLPITLFVEFTCLISILIPCNPNQTLPIVLINIYGMLLISTPSAYIYQKSGSKKILILGGIVIILLLSSSLGTTLNESNINLKSAKDVLLSGNIAMLTQQTYQLPESDIFFKVPQRFKLSFEPTVVDISETRNSNDYPVNLATKRRLAIFRDISSSHTIIVYDIKEENKSKSTYNLINECGTYGEYHKEYCPSENNIVDMDKLSYCETLNTRNQEIINNTSLSKMLKISKENPSSMSPGFFFGALISKPRANTLEHRDRNFISISKDRKYCITYGFSEEPRNTSTEGIANTRDYILRNIEF